MRDGYDQLSLANSIEKDIALSQRGEVEGFIATDEFGVPYNQYVSETPYAESEAFVKGRQLGKYPDPIRLIDVNSKRELRIPGEAFPDGLISSKIEVSLSKDEAVNREAASNTVGFIRVNGIEYPIVQTSCVHSGLGFDVVPLLEGWEEGEYQEGSYREPILDNFSKIRPGYKGGNTPNIFKSMEPCSKVNPKDVAKRRAKNKAVRKNKRK